MPTDFPTQQQMDAFGRAFMAFIDALPRIGLITLVVLAGVMALRYAVLWTLRLLDTWRLLKTKPVFLELTPFVDSGRTPGSTQKLYAVLHGLQKTRSWQDKLLQRRVTLPLELAGSRESGIRFIARTSESEKEAFQRDLAAHVPDIQFKEMPDYLPCDEELQNSKVLEFKLSREFVYPLVASKSLNDHDPATFLLQAMTQLLPKEVIATQFIVTPVKIRHADRIAAKVLHNELRLHNIGRRRVSIGKILVAAVGKILWSFVDIVSVASHGSSSYSVRTREQDLNYLRQVAKGVRPARNLGALEQQKLAEPIYDKLSQQLFRVNIRVLIAAHDTDERGDAIRKAFAAFDDPQYQALETCRNFPYQIIGPYRQFMFRHRLPSLWDKSSCVLSSAELAALYHFPQQEQARMSDMAKSLSRTVDASLAMKQNADQHSFDVILGRNMHLGRSTDIGLVTAERERHVYIIGATGTGKTTMLLNAIVQDMQAGKGLAAIDPHGDMAETLLRYVPKSRLNDVVYFNPDDLDYVIGLNPLELAPGLIGNDLLREKDMITESVVSIFRKIFSEEDSGGHRIEYVLRNAIHTALTTEEPTIFTVLKLLQNADYRKKITDKLEDEDLKDFWKSELGQAGNMQRVKMSAGVTSKLGRFKANASTSLVMGQKKSTIDFDDIINSGKILICNFSKSLGEDVSQLFGVMVLAKLQLAAYRRAKIPQNERRPFYVYVDEFQNFATPSFAQLLSESRKYKLFMTLAEQTTSQQQDQQLVQTILANVGTVVTFRTNNPADERLLLPLFKPYIGEGEMSNLPAYKFYAKLSAVKTQEPVSGETILLDSEGDAEVAAATIEASRRNYARKAEQLEPSNSKAETKEVLSAEAEETAPEDLLGEDPLTA